MKRLDTGGKPSTRFPPEGLVELTCRARSMPLSSYDILLRKSKFSKNHKKMSHFPNFTKILRLHLTLVWSSSSIDYYIIGRNFS